MRSGLGFSVVLGGRIRLGLWGSFKCQFLFLLLSSTPPPHHLFFNLGVCRQKGRVQMGSPAWESIDQGNGRLQVVIHYLINTQFIRRKKERNHSLVTSKQEISRDKLDWKPVSQSVLCIYCRGRSRVGCYMVSIVLCYNRMLCMKAKYNIMTCIEIPKTVAFPLHSSSKLFLILFYFFV